MNVWIQIILFAAGIIGTWFAISISVDHDKKEIDTKGHIVSHSKNWLLGKAPLCCFPIGCFSFASNFIWVWAILSSVIMVAAWFWTFFDGFLANRLKQVFFYVGSVSNSDGFLKPKPIWIRASIKILFILISTYFYVKGVL